HQCRLGRHPLQRAFRLLVTGPESLVGEQEAGLQQMRVEIADQVAPVTDLQAVRAKQFAQERRQTSLSGSLLAAQDNDDLGLGGRVLELVGEVTQQIGSVILVAAAYDIKDVLAQQRPV